MTTRFNNANFTMIAFMNPKTQTHLKQYHQQMYLHQHETMPLNAPFKIYFHYCTVLYHLQLCRFNAHFREGKALGIVDVYSLT